MNRTDGTSRISYLDGLRTFAVLFVILSHLTGEGSETDHPFYNHIHPFVNFGYQGVLIFFFISGYVISLSSFREADAYGDFSIRNFYIRRVFRIIPPLLFYLASCAILVALDIIQSPELGLLKAALYLCNVGANATPDCGWYGGHTWSLAFEEQFYLCFPMVFAFAMFGRKIPPWCVFPVMVMLLPFVMPVFFVGRTGFVIIYSLFISGSFLSRADPNVWLRSKAFSGFILTFALVATFFPVEFLTSSLAIGKYYKFIFILSIPLLVMSVSIRGSILNRICGNRFLARIGRATYSIYLWQEIFTGDFFATRSPLLQVACLCLMVVLCVLMYEHVEVRLIRYGRMLAARKLIRATVPVG